MEIMTYIYGAHPVDWIVLGIVSMFVVSAIGLIRNYRG